MKKYIAHVNLGGQLNHMVEKTNLSAAELLILQAIHGETSVHHIREDFRNKKNVVHEQLKDHLDKQYRSVKVSAGDNRVPVLRHVFPDWPRTNLPADAKEARIAPQLLVKEQPTAQAPASPGNQGGKGKGGKKGPAPETNPDKGEGEGTGKGEGEGTGDSNPGGTGEGTGSPSFAD